MLWLREAHGGQLWDPLALLVDEVVHRPERVWSLAIQPLGLTERARKVIDFYIVLVVTVHFVQQFITFTWFEA